MAYECDGQSDSKSDGGLDLNDVHDDLMEYTVLGHHQSQCRLDDLPLEDFEEGPLEKTPPDEVLLP
jgi:hypothetical protein